MAANETKLRQELVAQMQSRGELKDPRLLAAFSAVPRHHFLPDLPLAEVYTDEALPVKHDEYGGVVSSSSQPTMMAMMLRQLDLQPGHNVLEIGAGTGYNAAIMQHVVGNEGRVTTVELDKELAHEVERNLQRTGAGNIRVVAADGAGGYSPRAAYDRIIATAGVWDIPKAWVNQLKPGGIIVVPIWLDAMQVSSTFRVMGDNSLYSSHNLPCGFIRLRGTGAGPQMSRRVGTTGLILTSSAVDRLDTAALHSLLSDDAERGLLDVRLEAGDYYQGFLPYLILNLPDNFIYAGYSVSRDEQAYGIAGQGFALLSAGSACFVPFHAHGEALSFGATDAFLAVSDVLRGWAAAGRPGADILRLRLTSIDEGPPAAPTGKVYTRRDHYLHVWQEQ